jgi:hypothetical protein
MNDNMPHAEVRHESVGVNALNADMYRLVDGYLTSRDFQSFLHVNKHVHGEYVEYRYISLNRKFSGLYYRDKSFRDRVLALSIYPQKQLAVNLTGCHSISDVS